MRLGKTPYLCDYAMICPKAKKDNRSELVDKVVSSNKTESGKLEYDIASIQNDCHNEIRSDSVRKKCYFL